jgi:hypothetical protein
MNVDSFRQKTVQSGQGSLMQIFGQIKCLGFGAEGKYAVHLKLRYLCLRTRYLI